MAQEADTRQLDGLVSSWDRLLQQFPQEKQRLLQEMGRTMLERVRSEIGGAGKVSGWQVPHMGSGGGYVAVRAKADTYQTTKSGKRYAVGYVTNAIEGGHRIPRHRGSEGYRSRIHVAAVNGKWMYAKVRQSLPGMADDEVQRLVALILRGLEGEL